MYQQFWSEIGLWYHLFCLQGHSCCPMLYVIDGSGNLQFGGKLDTSTKKEAAGLRLAILKLVSWWHYLSFYEQFYFLNKCYRLDENETIDKIDLNNWSFTVNCYSFSLVLVYKMFLKILNPFLSFHHNIKILLLNILGDFIGYTTPEKCPVKAVAVSAVIFSSVTLPVQYAGLTSAVVEFIAIILGSVSGLGSGISSLETYSLIKIKFIVILNFSDIA